MNKFVLLIIVFFIYNCQSQENGLVNKEYRNYVGDIIENPKIDVNDFEICNSENRIMQYFNNSQGIEYRGGKTEILNVFKNEFIPIKNENQNGMIRIRFIVNCKGESGRFRIIEADNEYKIFHFNNRITNQLLRITKKLKGWIPKEHRNKNVDYYQYLIFKIVDGNIKEILP